MTKKLEIMIRVEFKSSSQQDREINDIEYTTSHQPH